MHGDGDEPMALELSESEGEDDALDFRVNKDFARRFEHNKKREELDRLKAKHPDIAAANLGEASDSEEEDDEEDAEEAPQFDAAFLETLSKIKKRDPSIYDKEKHFFPAKEAADAEATAGGKVAKSKRKKMLLKDIIAKQAIEDAENGGDVDDDAAGGGEDEDDDDGGNLTYAQQQARLKRQFLEAVDDEEEMGDEDDSDGDEGDDNGAGLLRRRGAGAEAGPSSEAAPPPHLVESALGQEEAFLRDYIANRRWEEDDGARGEEADFGRVVAGGGDEDDSEDEEELEKAEQFESMYNFRFEEPGGTALVSHPRVIEDSVRRDPDKRKRKRQEKSVRIEEERQRLQEEVKRLKNLKRDEISSKLKKIAKVAGMEQISLDMNELDEDFDPEAHDRKMAALFSGDYYDQEEEDIEALADEDNLEDELKQILGEKGGAERGFEAARAKSRSTAPGEEDGSDDEEDDDDEGTEEAAGSGSDSEGKGEGEEEAGEDGENQYSKRAQKKWRKQLRLAMEEYYKLDCEDFVAGMPTRFKYMEVEPNLFGLKSREIHERSDKELNQVVSLKRIAPYRDERPSRKFLAAVADKKTRLWQSRGDGKKRKKDKAGEAAKEEAEMDEKAARALAYAPPTLKGRKRAREEEKAGAGAGASAEPGKSKPNARKRKKLREQAKQKEQRSGKAA
mmetsp:Transcript_26745/g.87736  ORF Transcript_26745/g.87736 Transcript_26745/m.87736 type:complete len:677 (+) Transcript_26745:41-2071(+)